MKARSVVLLIGCWISCVAWAQRPDLPPAEPPVASTNTPAPRPEPIAADLREEIRRIEVKVRDLYSREETRSIALTVFRPPGAGPFPLAILSHGRSVQEQRAEQGRARFENQVRWLVTKGFAVLVPTRFGYGDTYVGGFDPEDSGSCQAKRYEPMAVAASNQVLTALEHARAQPDLDTSRWIAVGASVGGMTSLAVASRNPPGLVAVINFVGGAGGDPVALKGNPCDPTMLERLWRQQGASTQVPTQWLYWSHDRYWGKDWPQRWAKAWQAGGGKAEFHMLPPWSTDAVDGHFGFASAMDQWVPLAEDFLARVGFSRSGVPARPASSGFAKITDVDKVPMSPARRAQGYQRFLDSPLPRAFAIAPDGGFGWATGDWAIGRALGFCQARLGRPCKLYAVDQDVVWSP